MCSTGDYGTGPLPDVARLTDDELRELTAAQEAAEEQLAATLCVVHGQLDVLHEERIRRVRRPPTHVDITGAAEAILRRWLPRYAEGLKDVPPGPARTAHDPARLLDM